MSQFRTLTLVFTLSAAAAFAQTPRAEMNCNDRWGSQDRPSHCEIKEFTVATTGRLSVNGGINGGATIKGWNRGDVLVRAQIQTQADTDAEARALAGQIRVLTAGSEVRAEGPEMGRKSNWGVSYEIFVPQQTDVSVKTHNGGIRIADVRGRIEFAALNGGISLARLAGSVHGSTTNGGLHIDLAGNHWDGEGLEASSTNGGVTMNVPASYSARLETGTVNGGLHVDFPVTVQGEVGRHLTLTLGAGGALVRATTTNGGVTIRRQG